MRRGGEVFRSGIASGGVRQVFGGVASAAAYLLVLIAVRSAPLAEVAALRETSVVFGALAGWWLLGEPLGGTRVAAAAVIAAGVVLLMV
jgi:drug/metabolite transporter (DMT)-like permease